MRYLLFMCGWLGLAACKVGTVTSLQNYEYDVITEVTWEPSVIDSSLRPFMVVDGKIFEFIIKDQIQLKPVYDTIGLSEDRTLVKPKPNESDIERRWRDTSFVKVIDMNANKFVLIDKFSIDAAVIRSGNYDTSSLGTNLMKNTTFTGGNIQEGARRDTVLNGMPLLYSAATTYHDVLKDSFVTKTFYTSDTSLATPFSFIKCGGYHERMAGVHGQTRDGKFLMGQRVGNLRMLSDANTALCKAILKKIGW